ncbi:hypothetical protein DRW41_00530 [Neobacillus piezotolerans]|uniref:DnaD domain-containing protein n=1 Tax=Neobacillus piezotolerans TaxID=2259171 RepID=A0A3D8GUH5_9BACI|nr:DnaD domain protein [Neobacillus piezotolerans]RDU38095.1 hypothetical protein DRW41_00530 [Neobacillus piezotolerans]
MEDKKRELKENVLYGLTPEDRFKELHGITIEEWAAKRVEKIKGKTGINPEEWYIKRVTYTIPIDFLKEIHGVVTKEDLKLIKELQALGLNDDVINVLLHYVDIFSNIGMVHSLVREIGAYWVSEKILTIEKAVSYVREQQKKMRNGYTSKKQYCFRQLWLLH